MYCTVFSYFMQAVFSRGFRFPIIRAHFLSARGTKIKPGKLPEGSFPSHDGRIF
jgi:hypothetical protein